MRCPMAGIYQDLGTDADPQRRALMDLFDKTGGSAWSWTQDAKTLGLGLVAWGSEQPICSWTGVACCSQGLLPLLPCEGDSVQILQLEDYGLEGTLPEDSWGDLPQLSLLALRHNPGLSGTLPLAFSLLTNLVWLSVEVRSRVEAWKPRRPAHKEWAAC